MGIFFFSRRFMTENEFDSVIGAGVCAVKFSATWCGPCKRMEPTVQKLEAEFPSTRFIHVDVDEDPSLAQRYKIRTVPTLLIVKDGQEVNRVTGLSLIEPLRKIFKEVNNV